MSGGAGHDGHKLRISDSATSLLRRLHPHIKRKIRAAFEAVLSNPYSGKALRDELSELRSYRVGRYRVIYRISPSRLIEIVAVGPRESIYEETYRMLRKETGQE